MTLVKMALVRTMLVVVGYPVGGCRVRFWSLHQMGHLTVIASSTLQFVVQTVSVMIAVPNEGSRLLASDRGRMTASKIAA